MKPVLVLALCFGLAACKEDVAQNLSPVAFTAETLGHFCQMSLLEHSGPKAQIHLEGMQGTPLFFSQVRDAIAYQRLPEQDHPILAVYVSDMAAAGATWEQPGTENWIAAESAYYVLGSDREGGMGAPEAVPFSTEAAAHAFAMTEGGKVLRLAEIPSSSVLTPVSDAEISGHGDHEPANSDYEDRLRALSPQHEG